MNSVENIQKSLSRRLDEQKMNRQARLKNEIMQLRDSLPEDCEPESIEEIGKNLGDLNHAIHSRRMEQALDYPQLHALINLTSGDDLREIDDAFIDRFRLESYYPTNKLAYPTQLCETLEEFFRPILNTLNISDDARQKELSRLCAEAMQIAAKKGGGTYGFNLPGQGCFLNGWLFAHEAGIKPEEIYDHPQVFNKVMATAAHEKLGHGFISIYSSLGEINTKLGLSLLQIASQFGIAPSEDAEALKMLHYHNTIFSVSKFLEEGWATWVETFINGWLSKSPKQNKNCEQSLLAAVQEMPTVGDESEDIKKTLLHALGVILGNEDPGMNGLLSAIQVLSKIDEMCHDYFLRVLSQPLRYVLGEILCTQCELNAGELCVPYAVLIAGNISFDPDKISFTDLYNLFASDARLYPDVRLAAISKIKLNKKDDISEMTQKVHSKLSLSIPPPLRL